LWIDKVDRKQHCGAVSDEGGRVGAGGDEWKGQGETVMGWDRLRQQEVL
jgi:hypothetical protein